MNNNKSIWDDPGVCLFIIMVILSILVLMATYEPKARICEKNGCDREADRDSIYCYIHNPNSDYSVASRRIVRTSYHTPGTCCKDYCDEPAVDGDGYCSRHKCTVSGCRNPRESGSYYCTRHTCSCRNCNGRVVDTANQRCEEHRLDRPRTSTSSLHHSSSSRIEWPDCDDYEEFDEFMDDWEGNMPDGSDAEDYWDNW